MQGTASLTIYALSAHQDLMNRIEICGGIATGKTTLANLIADSGAWSLVMERFRENPFWGRFWTSPETWVEEKNFCFLVQHTGAIKAVRQSDYVVCDFAVVQDLAYASLVAKHGHVELMRALYDHLYREYEPPTLVVHLSCSPEVQVRRIRARGRPEEASTTVEYLVRLNEALDSMVRNIAGSTRVHHISTDVMDFASQSDVASAVKAAILAALPSKPLNLERRKTPNER